MINTQEKNNKIEKNIKKSLTRTIFLRSIGIVLVIMMLAFAAQILIVINAESKIREDSLREFVSEIKTSFVRAIWQINDDAIYILLASITSREEVQYAKLSSDYINIVVDYSGNKIDGINSDFMGCDHVVEFDFSNEMVQERALDSGHLKVCVKDQSVEYEYLALSLLSSLPFFIATVFVVIGLMAMISNTVIKPISAFTEHVRGGGRIARFKVDRLERDKGDEIDILFEQLVTTSRELAEERDIVRLGFFAISDGIIVTDSDYKIVRTNPAVKSLFDGLNETDKPHYLTDFIPVDALRVESDLVDFESRSGKPLQLTRNRIKESHGDIGYVFVFRDLTEKRQIEEEKRQASKLAAIGNLSSGVAHDFNNLLAVIQGNLNLMLQSNNLTNDERLILEAAKEAGDRGAVLTSQLLTFARKQRLQKSTILPATVLDDLQSMASRVITPAINITVNINTSEVVQVDESYLDAALLNLVINSRDAMPPEGGNIYLFAEDHKTPEGKFVAFIVRDDGCGISEYDLEHVYDPFFTTKGAEQGTGLGLSMVLGFAEQSGGKVNIESKFGEGTTVTILLPSIKQTVSTKFHANTKVKGLEDKAKDQVDKANGIKKQKLKTLIIDDKVPVALVLSQLICKLGHKTEVVNSLTELKQAEFDLNEFDVVLCDVVMPEHSGVDVHAYMQEKAAQVPFIFMSGNIPKELMPLIEKAKPLGVLQKPFSIDSLTSLLRNI